MLFTPGKDGASLALLTLGVVGDDRPLPDLQPKLPEGIHLRWAFDHRPERRLGFPWYGFYLFRRLTLTGGAKTCVAPQFAGQVPGTLASHDLPLALGTFHSDQNLVLTDDFPAPGAVEVDLSGRGFVSFTMDPAATKRSIEVKIGFVADFPPAGSTPGSGTGPGGGTGPGTGSSTGLGLSSGANAMCGCGCDHAAIVPVAERVVLLAPGQYRATFGYDNADGATVSMPPGPENRFFPDPADRGQPTAFLSGRRSNAFSVVFDGRPLTWRLAGHTVTVSAADASTAGTGGGTGTGTGGGTGAGGSTPDGIVVTALNAGTVVGRRVVSGRAGDIVTTTIPFEAIDEVRLSSGPARLVDLCVIPSTDGRAQAWAPAPNFIQPLCLPVFDPQYPCNPGNHDEAAAKQLAFSRIRYGTVNDNNGVLSAPDWEGPIFTAFHETLIEIVSGGPNKSGGITDFLQDLTADVDPNDPDAIPPQSVQQSSLDLLLTAAIHPAAAQMLGLYWVDTDAVEGQSYDYLLVADYENAGGRNLATVQALVTAEDYSHLEAYMRIGVVRAASPSLAPPANPRAYALPVSAPPPSAPGDAAGLIGIRWDVPLANDGDKIESASSILAHVWRKDFGRVAPDQAAEPEEHTRVTSLPIAPGEPRVDDTPSELTGWPQFSLYAVDGPLVEGWYGYRLSGIDIFGRHSALSPPAPWLDIANRDIPAGALPPAVHLIDTQPPSAPTQVRAWVLDPEDPFVVGDATSATWFQQHPGVTGLRVVWTWNGKQMLQAPDTKEFRVYINPGSQLDNPATASSWQQRIAVVGFDERVISDVIVPVQDVNDGPLQGTTATAAGTTLSLADLADFADGSSRLGGLPVDALEVELTAATGQKRFKVLGIDPIAHKLLLDATPQLSGSSPWTLGIRERTYEIFLPGSSLAMPPVIALPTAPTLGGPQSYGLVGVTAVDDKTNEVAIHDLVTSGPLANRPGNEGAVGGPSTVYQIYRVVPDPPASVFADPSLLATRADFLSRSFFMLHFPKSNHMSTHVYRALDQSLLMFDARKGFPGAPPNPPPNPPLPSRASELGLPGAFPSDWTTLRRQAVIDQINGLSRIEDYATLSNDSLRVLASFPSNAIAFTRLTETPIDPDDPADGGVHADKIGPNETTYVPASTRGSFLDTLDGRSTNRYFYRTAFVNKAHNVGPLGYATPPVYLPPTALPDAPVLQKAIASETELAITLTWSTSRTTNVTEYRIYRTAEIARARDIQLMEQVHVTPEVAPPNRPLVRTWKDVGVKGLITYVYRIVAVDDEGRLSPPTAAVQARAVDEALPTAPTLTAAWVVLNGEQRATLTWTSVDETLLQERFAGTSQWNAVGDWLPPGPHSVRDPLSDPGFDFEFRLRVRKYTGAVVFGAPITLVKQP